MKEEGVKGPPSHFMLDNCCPYFMDPIDFKWVFVLSPNGRQTVINIHGLKERGIAIMHQYVRPIKLPNWVGRVWLVPIPISVHVAAAEQDELVVTLGCNLPSWSLRP